MRLHLIAMAFALSLATPASTIEAWPEIRSRCVSNCYIPNPQPTQRHQDQREQEQDKFFSAFLGNAKQAIRDGNWDAAEGWARRALEQRPGSSDAQAILAQVESTRRRRAALAANSRGIELLNALDYVGARQMFQDALSRDPNDTVIRGNLKYASDRIAITGILNEATARRLDHEARSAAANQAAEERSRAGVETLAGRISGLAWTPCEGLVCAQAAIAKLAAESAVGSGSLTWASESARIPFDDNPGSITVIPPDRSSPVALQLRPQGGEAVAMRDRIEALQKEEIALAKQIHQAADPVQRAVLIQRESVTRSKRQVETIRYVSFVARYAPDKMAGGK